MGEGILKPFIELQGKTVLERVLEIFTSIKRFDNIIVLANPAARNLYSGIIEKFGKKVRITDGGSTRQESVRLGLEFLEKLIVADEENYVAVHDAARCLVDKQLIESAMDQCLVKKAVTLGIPVSDSIFRGRENNSSVLMESAVERKALYAVQTPQVFEYKLILDRHRHFQNLGQINFTDDCALLEGFHDVYIVPGSKNNFKITTKDDLVFAKAVLECAKV